MSQKYPVEALLLRGAPLCLSDMGDDSQTGGQGNGRRAPDGGHYREMARELRQLAHRCRFPGARRELLNLAASFDRRADHFDSRSG
jgi:hypothetical protein